jgi:hypothetical protein
MATRSAAGWPGFMLLLGAGAFTACSGGSSDNAQPGKTSATGIWSGTLTPADASQPPASGWLVVAADGSFHLDTDLALFVGSTQTRGATLSATGSAHPYQADITDGSGFTFNGSISSEGLTGTWSGANRSGTMKFRYDTALSQQAASLPAIASTYDGELWIGNSRQDARITIGADGTLVVSAQGGCGLNGTIGVADAARNGYQWTATAAGCAMNGMARGDGFLIGNYSVYLSGTLPEAPVWMGGADADAATSAGH